MRIDYVFVGIALVFMGLSLLALTSSISSGNVQYGGVIIIGPFPIVFGSSPSMAIFGVVFAVLVIVFMLVFMMMARRLP